MITEITISLLNRPGQLKKSLSTLIKDKINIQAFCVERAKEYSDLRLICDDEERSIENLKSSGFQVSLNNVFAIRLEHAPGSLYKIAEVLGDNDINIEYGYLTLVPKTNMAIVLIRVQDDKVEEAARVLKDNDYNDLDKIPIIRGR